MPPWGHTDITQPHPGPCVLLRAALGHWEQEVKLYVSLRQLRLFRQHKLWKAFKRWKSAINSTKLAAAKTALNQQLFLLSPVLQQPLQQFHALCHELSGMRLHSIQPGKVRVPQLPLSARREHVNMSMLSDPCKWCV